MAARSGGRRRHAFHKLRVSAVEALTEDSVTVTFEVPDLLREVFVFMPGQHLTLARAGDGDGLRRTYSICSPAGGPLRVAVKRLPGGSFSNWLHREVRPGGALEVLPPIGSFTLRPEASGHYAAIAAGSGITPVISMLASGLAGGTNSRFTLVFGNRTTESIMFLEELASLKDRYLTRLQIIHVLSREQQETPLAEGRIDAEKLEVVLRTLLPTAAVDGWFLCGPLELVETASASLLAHGVDGRRIHRELFYAGPQPETPPPSAEEGRIAGQTRYVVLLDGRRTRFLARSSGRSILSAILEVRPDAPFACKGGVCGTCRCRVTEGNVRMEHSYALEQDEIDAGIVLACQSFPTSDLVALDFDTA